MTVQEKIDYLVEKYRDIFGNADLFKVELEMLVLLAEKEQMKHDHEQTMEILRGKHD